MAFHPDSIGAAELPGAALVRSRQIKGSRVFLETPPGCSIQSPDLLDGASLAVRKNQG